MSKSRSQQAVDLSKQYTREQLAAAMIYGETRAGVDVKGKMSDPLAGIPELHVAQNRAKATGKDISEVLTKKNQFLGLNPASIKAVTDPDSLKGNADKAAARAAIDKAQGYFAGKYNDKVGKGGLK